VIQLAPFTPVSWHHPFWKDVDSILSVPYRGSISIDPVKSLGNLIRLITAATVFGLAFHLCRPSGNAKKALTILAWCNFGYAIYGILEWSSHTETVLWMHKFAYVGDLTSTFINRNNYATFAGMGWLCFLALFFRSYNGWVPGQENRQEKLRQTIIFFEKKGWYLLVAILVQSSALLLSHSRAGFASTLVGILAFCLSLAIGKDTDRRTVLKFTAFSLVLAVVFYVVGGVGLDQRLSQTSLANEERLVVYEKTKIAITDQPWLGTGLNTFEQIFRFYRPISIALTFDYAHNTYLETALELGIPAALLLLLALVYIFAVTIYGAATRRRDAIYCCLGIGCFVLVGLHSLVDFSVQIPAVTYLFFGLIGIATAQSFGTRERVNKHA
jgi:O-antigen ligase